MQLAHCRVDAPRELALRRALCVGLAQLGRRHLVLALRHELLFELQLLPRHLLTAMFIWSWRLYIDVVARTVYQVARTVHQGGEEER